MGAPYILARGKALDADGKYRDAMRDYNLYDTIMTVFYGTAPAEFYYTRYQCENKIRMYQQSLNDIAHACACPQGAYLLGGIGLDESARE